MFCLQAQPRAQAPTTFSVSIEDSTGAAIAGATATEATGKLLGRSDSNGRLTVTCKNPCPARVSASGFETKSVDLTPDAVIHLAPLATNEEVTVTAYRTPLGSLESPASTRELSQTALNSTAAITLDGKMRQIPGIELFRRSSSLVANPSSQGLSLRALGSTAASRTLITEDDVPLNDPFAGWIHWQEQPELSIDRIELVRGGASDLYGSSAIGGVVNIVPIRPTLDTAEFRSSYGSESTYDDTAASSRPNAKSVGTACRRRNHRHRWLHPGSAMAARPRRPAQRRAQPERPHPRRARPGAAAPLRPHQWL